MHRDFKLANVLKH